MICNRPKPAGLLCGSRFGTGHYRPVLFSKIGRLLAGPNWPVHLPPRSVPPAGRGRYRPVECGQNNPVPLAHMTGRYRPVGYMQHYISFLYRSVSGGTGRLYVSHIHSLPVTGLYRSGSAGVSPPMVRLHDMLRDTGQNPSEPAGLNRLLVVATYNSCHRPVPAVPGRYTSQNMCFFFKSINTGRWPVETGRFLYGSAPTGPARPVTAGCKKVEYLVVWGCHGSRGVSTHRHSSSPPGDASRPSVT